MSRDDREWPHDTWGDFYLVVGVVILVLWELALLMRLSELLSEALS